MTNPNDRPSEIWLMDSGDGIVWCDCAAPGDDICAEESVKYIRADLNESLRQQLEAMRVERDQFMRLSQDNAQLVEIVRRRANRADEQLEASQRRVAELETKLTEFNTEIKRLKTFEARCEYVDRNPDLH